MRNGNLVLNGGFETGDFTDWIVSRSGIFPQIEEDEVAEGSYAAYMSDGDGGLYGDGGSGTASISQRVSIPSTNRTPYLRISYMVVGEDADGEGYDCMEVLINDTPLDGAYWWSDTDGWQVFEYDLSDYVGKKIELTIVASSDDSSYIADYYVDDISITFE